MMNWKTHAGYSRLGSAIVIVILIASTVTCLKFADRSLDEQSIQGDISPEYPDGWQLNGRMDGSTAFDYYGGTDVEIFRSPPKSATFLAISTMKRNQARLLQRFSASLYTGKRVRFAGYLKTNRVSEWTGLWMRIDTKTKQEWSFDDMEDRALSGTKDWTLCEVVLDVPEDAVAIYIGAHMYGEGQVWVDDCSFNIVGDDVPATDRHRFRGGYDRQFYIPGLLEEEPVNLSFDEEFVNE